MLMSARPYAQNNNIAGVDKVDEAIGSVYVPLTARRNESPQGNNSINLLFCLILVFVMQKATFRNVLWYSQTDWLATDWRIDLFCCPRLYKHVLRVQIDENMRSNYECALTFQSSQRPWFLCFRFMLGPRTSAREGLYFPNVFQRVHSNFNV